MKTKVIQVSKNSTRYVNVTLSFSVFDNVKSGMYEIYFEE